MFIMDEEQYPHKLEQPSLFDFTEASTGVVELFPAVWSALEDLAGPGNASRQSALDRLLDLGAPRLSPLVAYLLATRLTDPDLSLRCRIVRALGQVLSPDAQGVPASSGVSRTLNSYLSQMRTRAVYDLLEVSIQDANLDQDVAKLLNGCPYAGNHLANILMDRKIPLVVREKAIQMIGMVGFLDALPTLERLEERLEARQAGQQAMPFAPPSLPSEIELLPSIRSTLSLLHSL
jgi:hypothetical protein